MSKIEDLIAQFCPEGVEFAKLGEVLNFSNGKGHEKAISENGNFIVVNSKFISTDGKVKKYSDNQISPLFVDDILLVMSDLPNGRALARTFFVDANDLYTLNQRICSLSVKDRTKLIPKFYYYLLNRNSSFLRFDNGVDQTNLRKDDILNLLIPTPPLPVQEEIVSILDKFTALEAELEAELEARTRQYEYYRNQLLAFEGKEVEWKTLGEVGEFIRGSGLQKTDFRESGVGCIHYGQIYTYYGTSATETKSFVSEDLAKKLRKAKTGDLVIAGVSENIQDVCKAVVWLGEEDICISGDSSAFRHDQNPKFIGYLFQTNRFFEFKKKYAQGAKVTRLRSGSLATFSIPVPSIEEQERIVSILDKFDALVNDISVGLPAEIQARKQQYEYYRGKLLSFEPLIA